MYYFICNFLASSATSLLPRFPTEHWNTDLPVCLSCRQCQTHLMLEITAGFCVEMIDQLATTCTCNQVEEFNVGKCHILKGRIVTLLSTVDFSEPLCNKASTTCRISHNMVLTVSLRTELSHLCRLHCISYSTVLFSSLQGQWYKPGFIHFYCPEYFPWHRASFMLIY